MVVREHRGCVATDVRRAAVARVFNEAQGRLVAGPALQALFGVCERTLIRDVDALRRQGMRIESERGLGYMLRSKHATA